MELASSAWLMSLSLLHDPLKLGQQRGWRGWTRPLANGQPSFCGPSVGQEVLSTGGQKAG